MSNSSLNFKRLDAAMATGLNRPTGLGSRGWRAWLAWGLEKKVRPLNHRLGSMGLDSKELTLGKVMFPGAVLATLGLTEKFKI